MSKLIILDLCDPTSSANHVVPRDLSAVSGRMPEPDVIPEAHIEYTRKLSCVWQECLTADPIRGKAKGSYPARAFFPEDLEP